MKGGGAKGGREEQELALHLACLRCMRKVAEQAGQELWVSPRTLGDSVDFMNDLASFRGNKREVESSRQLEKSVFLIGSC